MPDPTPADSGFFGSYSEFSRTVRTWFVGFGIGGPVVLMANEKIWNQLSKSGLLRDIGWLFLIGAGLQVISAILSKHSMWHLYFAEPVPTDSPADLEKKQRHRERWVYRLSDWYSEQNWIDEYLDTVSLLAFGWAIFLTVNILCPPEGMRFIRHNDESLTGWKMGVLAALGVFVARLVMVWRRR
jgi:hypothetical protein